MDGVWGELALRRWERGSGLVWRGACHPMRSRFRSTLVVQASLVLCGRCTAFTQSSRGMAALGRGAHGVCVKLQTYISYIGTVRLERYQVSTNDGCAVWSHPNF